MENKQHLRNNSAVYIVIIILISLFIVRNAFPGNKVQFSGDAKDQFLADAIVELLVISISSTLRLSKTVSNSQ